MGLKHRKEKHMSKMSKFQRSQKAHVRLMKLHHSRANTEKNRALGNYHAHCIDRQNESKRILSKQERRKMFKWWCNHEGYNPAK